MTHTVFVYGTLRPDGQPATHSLSGYRMYNYYNKFPYIVRTGINVDLVFGNILNVTTEELLELDKYEGATLEAGQLYARALVDARELGSTHSLSCITYVGRKIVPKLIETGDWNHR